MKKIVLRNNTATVLPQITHTLIGYYANTFDD